MRREAFALALCACGGGAPSSSTFDSGPIPIVLDASPGPNDELDAATPQGPACTAGGVRVIASGQPFDGPRVDDAFVYWTVGETDLDASTQGYWWSAQALHRADKIGGPDLRMFAFDSNPKSYDASLFAVDETSVYWITNQQSGFGSIARSAKDGSSQTLLVAGVQNPRGLVRAAGTLFFLSGAALMSIDVDGTNERIVAQSFAASELVVGAEYVYGIVSGAPVRVRRAGGTVEPLLLEPPGSIAYEGLSVGGDGYVHAIAKTLQYGWVKTVDVVRIPTDRGTPSVVIEHVAGNMPSSDKLFTAADGACLLYTTNASVFRSCGGIATAIGPGYAEAPPVADATTVYWRARTSNGTSIFAACKL